MSDLISRQAVIDIIHKEIERTTSFAEHQTQINIEMAVKELPIAYDKEAVENEVHNLRLNNIPHCKETIANGGCSNFGDCTECVLVKAEQMIKAGGIDG